MENSHRAAENLEAHLSNVEARKVFLEDVALNKQVQKIAAAHVFEHLGDKKMLIDVGKAHIDMKSENGELEAVGPSRKV